MKPAPFEYYAPTTVEEALAHLGEHGYDAKVLAGGQSLIPMMNFRLGAMTRHARVERDSIIAERAPLIHETMPNIATPQIRSRGTFGGSIAHADPSAELAAVSVALEGRFRIRGPNGERWVKANEFFIGMFTTLLEPDELLVEAEFPPFPARAGYALVEIARRPHDFALVGVTAVVALDGMGRCQGVRLVFLSVGDGPVEAHRAVKMLKGNTLTPEAIRAAAEVAASDDIDPGSDIHATAEFRRHLANVLARRALEQAYEQARA